MAVVDTSQPRGSRPMAQCGNGSGSNQSQKKAAGRKGEKKSS
jgi:hypothetical protein